MNNKEEPDFCLRNYVFEQEVIPKCKVKQMLEILKHDIEYIDNRDDGLVSILEVKKLIIKLVGKELIE